MAPAKLFCNSRISPAARSKLSDHRVVSGVGLDDLGVQAHGLADPGDGAFDDEVDAQLAGDLRQELRRVLVVHRGLA
jgi:hypothetical protein